MSEIRDDLESAFSSAEEQSEAQNNSNVIEEHSDSQPTAEVDEWMDAPNSYTNEYKETFKTLPQNWRKYLTEREKQVEKGFSDFGNKVNAYKWSDNLYNERQERLAKAGFNNAREYTEYLTQIDDALSKDPTSAIKAIAEAYGINNLTETSNVTQDSVIERRLQEMQTMLRNQEDYIRGQQIQKANQAVAEFSGAKDDNGNLKHPFFDDVREQMVGYLSKEVCQGLDDAYELAIYANPNVRAKLIAEQTQKSLNSKVVQAEKAKEAGFTPKAKSTPTPKATETIRDDIEAAFAQFGE